MANFKLTVLSPSRPIANVTATSVAVPATAGYMEILPNHAALISEINVGQLTIKKEQGEPLRYFISGGYVEVLDNDVTILADVVEAVTDIDRDRAAKAQRRAEERLVKPDPNINLGRALSSLRRAQGRLDFLDAIKSSR